MKLAEDITGKILVQDDYKAGTPDAEAAAAYAVAEPIFTTFWNQLNKGAKVTCCEVVANREYRFKVCAGMDEHIVAYMDYVEPQEVTTPEMQYINRRTSDGALWPTMFRISSPGWEEIGAYEIDARHEVGDTVLVANNDAKPEHLAIRGTVKSVTDRGVEVDAIFYRHSKVHCINFSKGDHLAAQERDAWEAEAAGFQ